ncbi:MAG: sodium:proline symporter [Verrucomicrobiae bacterium]|nr:sodium:proline symporter [Verrucomicrobiae bacterium]
MHGIDYAIVLVPLVIVLVVSWSTRRYMKSVADFMSASRCAGRYLVCTASGEAAFGAISAVAIFEYLYKAGFAIGWWNTISTPVGLMLTLTGFVIYRYRETRAMTIAQFFEIRYSRNFRVFAGIMAWVSGIVNYGIFPAVGARFFVSYCGLPQHVLLFGRTVPTFGILMIVFIGFALFLTLTGGQLTIMVSDALEGLLSGALYVIVAIAVLWMFSWKEISEAMSNVPPGQSMLNPFDTAAATDFNVWYVLIGIFSMCYNQMGWQGGHAFRSSAANPHEAKMGNILGSWRGGSRTVMITLLGVCAFTYMTHPDFAAGAAAVNAQLQGIDSPQIQTQMRVPVALSHLLPVGVKGAFAAIMFFAMIACDGSYMHSWGSIFIQDVVLPFRKKSFTPKQHIRLLRWSIAGVGVFAFLFGLFFNQTDYILMFFAITGAIFLGGSGCAILGGLYWKRGTTVAAWAGMITGSGLAVSVIILQQVWTKVVPHLARAAESAGVPAMKDYLLAHAGKFPASGQVMYFYAMLTAVVVYVVVSLLTCRTPFNIDRMLHRGKYARNGASPETAKRKFTWGSLLGFDREFTFGDKIISASLFCWSMFWFAVFIVMTLGYLLRPWPIHVWSTYWHINQVIVPLLVGIVTTVWFTWGGTRDLIRLFRTLPTVKRDARDDGTVVSHHNLDEEPLP